MKNNIDRHKFLILFGISIISRFVYSIEKEVYTNMSSPRRNNGLYVATKYFVGHVINIQRPSDIVFIFNQSNAIFGANKIYGFYSVIYTIEPLKCSAASNASRSSCSSFLNRISRMPNLFLPFPFAPQPQ